MKNDQHPTFNKVCTNNIHLELKAFETLKVNFKKMLLKRQILTFQWNVVVYGLGCWSACEPELVVRIYSMLCIYSTYI